MREALKSLSSSEEDEEANSEAGDVVECAPKRQRQGGWGRTARSGDLQSDIKEERWRWPSHSSRWLTLLENESLTHPSSYAAMAFRGKFCVPYQVFKYLLRKTEESGKFAKDKRTPGSRGTVGHPLCLKVLSCLRVLTKGCDVDTVSEVALISPTVLLRFNKKWLAWLVEVLFPQWVKWPTLEEAKGFMGE